MEQYRRIGAPVTVQASLYRNATLWESQGRHARLVVGGPAHGQVLISEQPILMIAVPMDVLDVIRAVHDANGAPQALIEEHLTYSAAEVGIAGRIYRTWMGPNDSPDEHVAMAVSALADSDPRRIETCRAA